MVNPAASKTSDACMASSLKWACLLTYGVSSTLTFIKTNALLNEDHIKLYLFIYCFLAIFSNAFYIYIVLLITAPDFEF